MKQKKIYSVTYLIAHLAIQSAILLGLLKNFDSTCENKTYLTWDPELRYVYSLSLLNALKRFDMFEFGRLVIDTPTWPPLRNFFHLILFWIFGQSPSIDIYLSLGEFFILDSILTYIAVSFEKTKPDKWRNFLVAKFLYLSPALLLYSFSGMLEIQGGLFLLLSTFFFSLNLVRLKKTLHYSKIFYGLSFLALYFTKYPYGYMFLISSGLILFFYERKDFYKILKKYQSSKFIMHVPILIALIALLTYYSIPKEYLVAKLPRYFKFTIGLFLFIEVIIFILKEKKLIQNLNPNLFAYLVWTVIPVGFWTFIHPDRFGSSNSTVSHVQSEGYGVGGVIPKNWEYYTFFYKILFQEIWIKQEIGIIFQITLLLIFLWRTKLFFYSKKISLASVAILMILLHIIQLTFLTPNHQARHVYHLTPIIFLSFIFALREIKTKGAKFLSLMLVLCVWIFVAKDLPNYFLTLNLCFSGKGNFYEPVNNVKTHLDRLITEDVYLINKIEEGHLHRMNLEYLTAQIAFNKGLQYYKKKPTHKNFITLIIARKCKDSSTFYEESFLVEEQVQTNEFCLIKLRSE